MEVQNGPDEFLKWATFKMAEPKWPNSVKNAVCAHFLERSQCFFLGERTARLVRQAYFSVIVGGGDDVSGKFLSYFLGSALMLVPFWKKNIGGQCS